MNVDMLVGLLLILLVVVVPVLGFTARFALKPIVESLLQLHTALLDQAPRRREDARLLELEAEIQELRNSLGRLERSREWEQALLEGETPESPGEGS